MVANRIARTKRDRLHAQSCYMVIMEVNIFYSVKVAYENYHFFLFIPGEFLFQVFFSHAQISLLTAD